MRALGRSLLIALVICGLVNAPVLASGERALGVVIESQIGRLGNANVTIGTSVYSGDTLSTDIGGTLRMKVGGGQIYLLASSTVTLGQAGDAVQATVVRGTAGFSTTPADKVELLIPEGILRAASGQPAYGQVTIVSPNEAIVTTYRGALELDNDGEIHMFGAGTSYRVSILPDDTQQPEGAGTQEYPQTKPKYQKKRHLAFELLLVGIAGAASYIIYHQITVSPSKFN